MWNSSSDNKKSEDLEDCSCSSRSSVGSGESSVNTGGASAIAAVNVNAAAQTTQQQQQQQQQQKLNSFDNTTETSTTKTSSENNGRKSSVGQEFKNDFSKLNQGETAETIDSGFISGPQSQPCLSEDDDEEVDNTRGGGVKENKQHKQAQQQQQQQQPTKTVNKQLNIVAAAAEEDSNVVPDSGIIDEEFDDEDEDIAEYEEQRNLESEQEQAAAKGSFHQQLAAGHSAVATSAAAAAAASTDNSMILKQNVDAGMSEWFCNLSLQTTPTTTQNQPQQQQQQKSQQTVAGINNLNSAGQRVTINAVSSASISRPQQQQQPKAAGNSATTTTTTTTPITATNAWEKFYQQNDDGDTPLHLACISGYEEVVATLIRMAPHPCLFNIQNDEAQTALHLAVLTAQPKILRMLLIAGAEPTIRDRHGNTALHLACISGEEQCVRALTLPISASEINEAHRQYGHRSNDKMVSYLSCARLPSDLEIRNYDGERCVHLAAQAGHIEVLRILVFYDADINAREGKSGRTPLHIAIESCNEDLVNFLLDECSNQLNLETVTYAGLTAYQVACILNKSQMQSMLEKRGAEPLTPPDSDYDSDMDSDIEDSKMYDRFGDPGYFISSYNGGSFMTVA